MIHKPQHTYPPIGLLIDGAWIYDRPALCDIENPSDESILGQVPKATAADLQNALASSARANLQETAASNVTVIEGDSAAGHAPGAPYDAILVNGAAADISRILLDQLKDGGRLVAVVSNGSFGHLTVWRRLGGTFDAQVLSDAAAPALAGFAKSAQFVF